MDEWAEVAKRFAAVVPYRVTELILERLAKGEVMCSIDREELSGNPGTPLDRSGTGPYAIRTQAGTVLEVRDAM